MTFGIKPVPIPKNNFTKFTQVLTPFILEYYTDVSDTDV